MRINIFLIRWLVCHSIEIVLGLTIPIINSIKAIQNQDKDAIFKELTYWTLYATLKSIESIFVKICKICGYNYHPEIYAIVLLYLALPKFQGSLIIYKRIAEPFFIQNEQLIDDFMTRLSQSTSKFVSRHFQIILWQLLFSSEGITSFFSESFIKNNSDSQLIKNDKNLIQNSINDSKLSVSKQILVEITEMLGDESGLALQVLTEKSKVSFYCLAKLLLTNPNYLSFTSIKKEPQRNIVIPLFLVQFIDISFIETSERAEVIHLKLWESVQCNNERRRKDVFILTDNLEDSDALIGGLQVLCSSIRSKYSRKLLRSLQILNTWYISSVTKFGFDTLKTNQLQ